MEAVQAAFPHLEVVGLIGAGGMGFVYKARQPRLDRFVALKLLPESAARSPAFAERFTQLVGVSPMAHLFRWRMSSAAEQLRDGGLSVAEVAVRSGYESEAAFSKAFKRQFGVPPGAFRRTRLTA